MSQEKNENTYTAPNRQVQKSPKEKTMATGHTNSLASIDVSKPLTDTEIALISKDNENIWASSFVYSDSIADYYPGKYQKHTVVAEPAKEEEKKDGYITSYVGDYVSNPPKGIVANLAKDVIFVQEHLKRLSILSEKDFNAEKPSGDKEISKSKIPKTIDAINWFQSKVLHYNTKYGYVVPGKGTIKNLVNISVEEKDTKHKEYLEKEKAKQKRIAEEKAKAEKEAEIERIKNEPVTIENLTKIYNKLVSIEAFGKFLTDYVQFNPKFVLKAYDLMGFGESDNLTRAIMINLKDSEIEKLPDVLDLKFYESLDAGWTVDEEYALMNKLKTGKKVTEVSEVKPTIAKEKSLVWGKKVDANFRKKVVDIAKNLEADPNHLMAIIAFESGGTFSPSVKNAAGSGAIGLIQFMSSTAKALGTTTEKMGKMTAVEQLDYVEKYFKGKKGKLKTIEDFYMAVLWPVAVGKDNDYVLFNEDDKGTKRAYSQNKGLDANKDKKITKEEAGARVKETLEKGKKFKN